MIIVLVTLLLIPRLSISLPVVLISNLCPHFLTHRLFLFAYREDLKNHLCRLCPFWHQLSKYFLLKMNTF